jgi:hypothetical protein
MPVSAVSERNFSIVLDDIADLIVAADSGDVSIDICCTFPEIDLDSQFDCDSEFILSVEDVDESLFVNESVVLLKPSNSDTGSSRFGTATIIELENVRRGGARKSEATEKWATRSFDDWQVFRGLSTEKNIGELSEELDLRPFVNLLTKFMLEVKKKDGELYHPNT